MQNDPEKMQPIERPSSLGLQAPNLATLAPTVAGSLPIIAGQFLRVRLFHALRTPGNTITVRIGVYAQYAKDKRAVQQSQMFEKGGTDVVIRNGEPPVFLDIPLYYGNLYSVSIEIVSSTSPVERGELYATVSLYDGPQAGTGAQLVHLLIANYVETRVGAAWPSGEPDSPEDAGRVSVITGLAPVAGAEIVQTVPANAKWKILGVRFRLTTSAVAGNRTPIVAADFGGAPIAPLTMYGGNMDYLQPAATVALYSFDINSHPATVPTTATFPGGIRFGRLNGEFWLNAGDSIKTFTPNLDPTAGTGDIFTGIAIVIKQSITPS